MESNGLCTEFEREGKQVSMKKYSMLLMEQINNRLGEWREQNSITERELYAFLHRIKGTAGTVGLPGLSDTAKDLLAVLNENSSQLWDLIDWEDFLLPFIEQLGAEPSDMLTGSVSEISSTQESLPSGELYAAQGDRIVLIIDQDLEFLAFLKEHLEADGYVALVSLTFEKGMEMFYRMRPAFVLLDLDMIKQQGPEEMRQFVSAVRKSVTPIALTSNNMSMQDRMLTYQMGASDYLHKPLDLSIFMAYLNNRLVWQQDIQRIATIDELTGAFNRKYMKTVLPQLLDGFEKQGRSFCIGMLDLDHFKQVNDRYGHLVGDEVLKRLVCISRSLMRQKDEIFRFGGEEFIICMPDTDSETGFALMENIRQAFAQEIFCADQEEFQAAFSAGIAMPVLGDAQDDVIDKADQALYQSKANGRNRTTIYNREVKQSESRSLHMIIVDDDPVVRSVIEQGFMNWKCSEHVDVQVHAFPDGVAFLESDWYHPQDQYVVLLDGMLPKMDGIEVLTELRKNYPDKNVVISMLSARADEGNIIHALEKGADDYLFKPFNITEVVARMDRLAQRLLL